VFSNQKQFAIDSRILPIGVEAAANDAGGDHDA